ncbi:glycosyltransferase family 2 protein [Candidatus Gottesmanbacteria bacterium]|nr:glycosyltransferase family 2 protein [Candidatus Gottesmanbacteria bacterium]
MINNKTISLVIPCKNEAEALKNLLPKIPRYIDEVIVVDNQSTDDSIKVAKRYKANVIREARQVGGVGYGYAIQSGIKFTHGDYIIVMDGDDTYPIAEAKKIIERMVQNKIDFISCNRFPLINKKAIPKIRQLGVLILNLEVTLLYGYPIKDILSGMWITEKETIEKIIPRSGDWNFSPEIKINAINNPIIRFGEYHIEHFYRMNGKSKLNIWRTGWSHLWFIFKKRIFSGYITNNFNFNAIRQNFSYSIKQFLF